MQVMSMVVNDEFGVMQRILQEFTRRKINVETIVVGKCEIPGKARVVLTIVDRVQAERSVEALSRLHDIIQCELVDERFTLIAADNYRGDFLEVKLWDRRGEELARESLYVDDEDEADAGDADGAAPSD